MSGELRSHEVQIADNHEGIQLTQRQASTSHDNVPLEIEDGKLITGLLKQKNKIMQEEKEKPMVLPKEENRTKIQRVPRSMLQHLKDAYFQPKELSIGFFHASFRHRGLKLQLAAYFMLESSSDEKAILQEFKNKMKDIKTCFDEKITKRYINDKQLMRLLFLDGCAMLGFIHSYVNQKLKVVGVSDAQAVNIERDLLLLENQIPFQVLELLIDSGTEIGKKNLKESFLRFIFHISSSTFHRDSPEYLYKYVEEYCFSPKKKKSQKPAHLLDLFREVLLLDASSFYFFEKMLTLIRAIFCIFCICGCIAICCVMRSFKNTSYDATNWRITKQFFQSVQVLKAARIRFKPTHSLKSVTFYFRFFGTPKLMLPTLVIDDSTEHKLLNLVAYELCLSKSHPSQKPWVTSYVNLLDLLIENEQDYKDLKAADILRNNLKKKKDFAYKIIKSIGSRSFEPSKDTYAGVKKNIQKHCRSKYAIWWAEICETHFSSPWTVLALFASTAVVVLTAVQTWYAVNPKK